MILLSLACIAEQLHWVPESNETQYRSVVASVTARIDPDCEVFFLTIDAAEPQADD